MEGSRCPFMRTFCPRQIVCHGRCVEGACRLVGLVDFRVPEGFRASLERDVSSVLKKGLTVGFTPTRMASINVAWSQPTRSLSLGRYWVDSGLLEAVHLHRCHASPWLFSLATCIGKHPVFDARGCASLGRRSPSSSVNWTFESRGSIFGAQYLRRLFTHCLVGGELYYTATESSGGRMHACMRCLVTINAICSIAGCAMSPSGRPKVAAISGASRTHGGHLHDQPDHGTPPNIAGVSPRSRQPLAGRGPLRSQRAQL